MTDAEYTEQALEHLADLEDHIADRVMNKIDEATERAEYRVKYHGRGGPWLRRGL
ncbi:MAG: hypothetical protein ACLFR6_01315 [Salinarchaeum sp.]